MSLFQQHARAKQDRVVSIEQVVGVLGLCRTTDVSNTSYLALAASKGAELKVTSAIQASKIATDNELKNVLRRKHLTCTCYELIKFYSRYNQLKGKYAYHSPNGLTSLLEGHLIYTTYYAINRGK